MHTIMPTVPLAAILYTPEDEIEALMARIAATLVRRGLRLGGVIQHDITPADDPRHEMELEDLVDGRRFSLTQDLGSGSSACSLDTAALAQAAAAVRSALAEQPDLILINKFGAQEAGGAGLRDEIGEAVAAGVPLLTAVGARFIGDWQTYTGGDGVLLEPRLDAVLAWWDGLAAG